LYIKCNFNPGLIYLFWTDLERFSEKDHLYSNYEQNEPGYGRAVCLAYIEAFKHPNNELSLDLIKSVHDNCTQHFTDNDPRGINTHWGSVNLVIKNVDSGPRSLANTSRSGLKQFIKSWIINNQEPIHTIQVNRVTFKNNKKTLFPSVDVYAGLNHGQIKIYFMDWENKKKYELNDKNLSKPVDIIMNKLFKSSSYQAKIYVSDSVLKDTENHNSLYDVLLKYMENICTSYNKEIRNATNNYDILFIIAAHLQNLDQLHAFKDGNVRTCYVLLNFLLHKNNLPLCIPANPNRFDWFSVQELVQTIIVGQHLYLQICQGKIPTIKNSYNNKTCLISNNDIPGLKPYELGDFIAMIKTNWNNTLLSFSKRVTSPHPRTSISITLSPFLEILKTSCDDFELLPSFVQRNHTNALANDDSSFSIQQLWLELDQGNKPFIFTKT